MNLRSLALAFFFFFFFCCAKANEEEETPECLAKREVLVEQVQTIKDAVALKKLHTTALGSLATFSKSAAITLASRASVAMDKASEGAAGQQNLDQTLTDIANRAGDNFCTLALMEEEEDNLTRAIRKVARRTGAIAASRLYQNRLPSNVFGFLEGHYYQLDLCQDVAVDQCEVDFWEIEFIVNQDSGGDDERTQMLRDRIKRQIINPSYPDAQSSLSDRISKAYASSLIKKFIPSTTDGDGTSWNDFYNFVEALITHCHGSFDTAQLRQTQNGCCNYNTCRFRIASSEEVDQCTAAFGSDYTWALSYDRERDPCIDPEVEAYPDINDYELYDGPAFHDSILCADRWKSRQCFNQRGFIAKSQMGSYCGHNAIDRGYESSNLNAIGFQHSIGVCGDNGLLSSWDRHAWGDSICGYLVRNNLPFPGPDVDETIAQVAAACPGRYLGSPYVAAASGASGSTTTATSSTKDDYYSMEDLPLGYFAQV